jgi:hypothetical protein
MRRREQPRGVFFAQQLVQPAGDLVAAGRESRKPPGLLGGQAVVLGELSAASASAAAGRSASAARRRSRSTSRSPRHSASAMNRDSGATGWSSTIAIAVRNPATSTCEAVTSASSISSPTAHKARPKGRPRGRHEARDLRPREWGGIRADSGPMPLRSGQRPGQNRPQRGDPKRRQTPLKVRNPRRCRGSRSGASRTRTGRPPGCDPGRLLPECAWFAGSLLSQCTTAAADKCLHFARFRQSFATRSVPNGELSAPSAACKRG